MRTSHVYIMTCLRLKHNLFILIMLAKYMKLCLNNRVQKHTHIYGKSEALTLIGELSSSKIAAMVDLTTILEIRRKEFTQECHKIFLSVA